MEVTVIIDICIVSIVIIIDTICSTKEITILLVRIVIKVIIGVNFEEIPDPIVVVIDVIPIIHRVIIVIEVNRCIREIAINVAVNVVFIQICAKFIREICNYSVVGSPLPNSDCQSNPSYESISVVDHLEVSNT